MLSEKWVVLSALLSLGGTASYVVATLRGQTQPNRVTWALWGLLPMITFVAQLGEDVGLSAVMTFTVGFGPLLVLASSFVNPAAYWQLGRGDIFCGVLSVIAIGIYLVTRHGPSAIAVALVADLAAGWPTIIKAWRRPDTEDPMVFGCAALASIVTLLTLDRWRFADAAFPLFILTTSVVLFVLVQFPALGPGRRRIADPAPTR